LNTNNTTRMLSKLSTSKVIQEVLDGVIPFSTSFGYRATREEGDVEVLKASNCTYKVACKFMGVSTTQIVTPVQEYKGQGPLIYPPIHPILQRDFFMFNQSDVTKSKTPSRAHFSNVGSLKEIPSSRVFVIIQPECFAGSFACRSPWQSLKHRSTHLLPKTIARYQKLLSSLYFVGLKTILLSSSILVSKNPHTGHLCLNPLLL